MQFEVIKRLETELEALARELRVDIPKMLKTAADYGDLSENAEYEAAKERKAFVESRIGQLQKRISEILSINMKAIPKDKVGLMSTVKLEDAESGEELSFTFVFPEEVDPDHGKISLASPIGKSLVGKTEGDIVKVNLPRGLREFEIISLTTIHEKDS